MLGSAGVPSDRGDWSASPVLCLFQAFWGSKSWEPWPGDASGWLKTVEYGGVVYIEGKTD